MGQRLNIEILGDDRVLANAYYHWGAYTRTAVELTEDALNAYDEYVWDIDDQRALAIKMLEGTGAGVPVDEQERINADARLCGYVIRQCNDRNTGLLSITERGITETEQWEEGRVTIDITSKRISFDLYYTSGSFEEWTDFCWDESEQANKTAYRNLKNYDVPNLWDMTFDEFDRFAEIIRDCGENSVRNIRNGEVYHWVQ